MKWRQGRRSTNVEDRRRTRRAGLPFGIGGLVILVIAIILGANPRRVLTFLGTAEDVIGQTSARRTATPTAPGDEGADFVSVVLADTEDVWGDLFAAKGKTYRQPKLVLFSGAVRSACGFAQSAMGPFYCPGDDNVYLDLQFFDELTARLGAPGDFAQAYVIAHEIGHHVQNQLGISDKMHAMRSRLSEEEYNEMSVRLELQADFLAGVWAHHAQRTRSILERGDIEEAVSAAAAVGDDRLQRAGTGHVVPDSFTHGTSEQRARWFLQGFKTGDFSAGDTFSIPYEDL